MQIGIIREGKAPPDARVALIPEQCAQINQLGNHHVFVQPSPLRAFRNAEYEEAGVELREDLTAADLLMGVKEVPIAKLIPGKTYCMFAHVIKKQPYNRPLLRAILDRGIRLIDYEVITNEAGQRLIAFGFYAGMVGAHNALFTYGQRTGHFELPRLHELHDYAAALPYYQQLELPACRIVLTGTGRVGAGAAKVLDDMGIRRVEPAEFLNEAFPEAVYTQLDGQEYARRKDGAAFEKQHFYSHPEAYASNFLPYAQSADVMINGIYWDNRAPAFFTPQEMARPDFRIRTIADVTCDIAPEASIPSTLQPSTIAEPVYGYHVYEKQVVEPYQPDVVDVMAIDNLPSELPRDASRAFGQQFIEHVLPEFDKPDSAVLERATIAENGKLTDRFAYLQDYVDGAL